LKLEWSRSAGERVPCGVGLGAASGGEAGVLAGVGTGVGARGSVACSWVVGVAVPSGLPAAGGCEGFLHEDRTANVAAKASARKRALFIVTEIFAGAHLFQRVGADKYRLATFYN
jgi:hypothetical protein